MAKNLTYWVVVRQAEGDPEHYDWSTKAGTPSFAREFATWNETKTISPAYWKANPAIGIAKIEVSELDRWEWWMNEKVRIGKRVELVHTSDPYTDLKIGDQGTVLFTDNAETVFVKWDNGSRLGMIPGEDIFKYLPEEK